MKINWPINAGQHAFMAEMQRLNRGSCLKSAAESWMFGLLKPTGLKWTRQAQWGYRLFDFWCAKLGLAVEVDGPEHSAAWDSFRDDHNYRTSGIVVIRVPNFSNSAAAKALLTIARSESWNDRRRSLGLKPVISGVRKPAQSPAHVIDR